MPIRPAIRTAQNGAKIVPVRGAMTRVIPKPPEDETKDAKFERIATRRMNVVLKGLFQLGSMAGPNYEYTDTKIDAMEETVLEETRRTFTLLRSRTKRRAGEFTFKSSE